MADEEPFSAHRAWFTIVTLAAVVIIGILAFGRDGYLALESLKAHRQALADFADAHILLASAIAFVAFTVIVALSLPGGLIMSLVCGFIFGRVLGTVLGVLATTAGATLLFLGARYLFADAARRRIGRLGARVDAGFAANAFHYVLFLRIAPVVPFFLANLALAFMSIPLRTYVVATFIGVIPGIFVYANLGQALGSIESLSGLLSLETLTALGLLGAFALAPVVLRAVRARATRSD